MESSPGGRRRGRSSSRRSNSVQQRQLAAGSVGLCRSRTMNGQKKLFHAPTKVNRNSIAAAGRAATTPTVQKVRIMDAPSMRDASISSSGTVWPRYCVIQNTPNALVEAGTITAPMVPVQPRSAKRMYRGTTPSCIPARPSSRRRRWPLAASKAQFRERPPGECPRR